MRQMRVAICWVVAPVPQPEPTSRLRSATRDVSFLGSDSRCRRYVNDLSNVTPRYLGSEQKGRVSLLKLTFSSRLASLLLRWKPAYTVFVVLSFSFQVWRHSFTFAMPLVITPSTSCFRRLRFQASEGSSKLFRPEGFGDTVALKCWNLP